MMAKNQLIRFAWMAVFIPPHNLLWKFFCRMQGIQRHWDLISKVTLNIYNNSYLPTTCHLSLTDSNETPTRWAGKEYREKNVFLHGNWCGFVESEYTRKLFTFQQLQTSTTTSWNVAHQISNSYFLHCSNRISTSNDCCHSLPTKFCKLLCNRLQARGIT